MTTQYVAYTYYLGPYKGNRVASSDFDQLALRASAEIDILCFSRAAAIITADTDLPTIDAIQMATCAVVDELHKMAQEGTTSGVKSESVGGHSVTYADSSPATKSLFERVKTAAALYLAPTFLMFPGFSGDEYSSQVVEP